MYRSASLARLASEYLLILLWDVYFDVNSILRAIRKDDHSGDNLGFKDIATFSAIGKHKISRRSVLKICVPVSYLPPWSLPCK